MVRLQNCGAVLLADSGYGLEPWLTTPFRICHTNEENAFNRLLKKERVIIERSFVKLRGDCQSSNNIFIRKHCCMI
jgi:hypothetical protein